MRTLSTNIKLVSIKNISIFIIWLFHLSAIIGISLGYFDWFVKKTPLNLIILGILTAVNFPINTKKNLWAAAIFFLTGMLAEWIGVHYGFLFGEYIYGDNLGVKGDGVPILIGVNWVILTLCTAAISAYIFKGKIFRLVFGGFLMVFLDFFIEGAAAPLDFWIWATGDAPWRNYISWFIISIILHWFYHKFKIKGDFTFSLHLYLTQIVFFAYFYIVYRL